LVSFPLGSQSEICLVVLRLVDRQLCPRATLGTQ